MAQNFSIYSLADHSVTVEIPQIGDAAATSISFGGAGEYIGSIQVNRTVDMFTTEADATGAYVHNKTLNKSGRLTIEINQMAAKIDEYVKLCNALEKANFANASEMITISISRSGVNTSIVECNGCVPTKIPDFTFGNTATTRRCDFTCGEVNFK